MRKIPTIFERNWEARPSLVIDQPQLGCEWVFDGEGIATRKYDGQAVLVSASKLFKRRELKPGDDAPEGWRPVSFDTETQKEIGWVPVDKDKPEDQYLYKAFVSATTHQGLLENGTYEAVGPKIQGGLEGYLDHTLLKHDQIEELPGVPRNYEGLKKYFTEHNEIEGVVWHHEDGHMGKIKLKDFGLKRKPITESK